MMFVFEILLLICLLIDIMLRRDELLEDIQRFGTWLSCLYRSTVKYILRLVKHISINQ